MKPLFSIPDLVRAMPSVVLGDGQEYQIQPMNALQSARSRALGVRLRDIVREEGAEDEEVAALIPDDLLADFADLAASCVPTAPRAVVDDLVPRYHFAIIETAGKTIEDVSALVKNGNGATATDSPPPSSRATPTDPSSSPLPATADVLSGT